MPPVVDPSWTSSGPGGQLGVTAPRLWTPPLCSELTPETSFGWEVIEFAEWAGTPLDPWEQWLVIHAGELLPDGRPRFRVVLVLVARQNGKTTVLRILALWWLFVDLADGSGAKRTVLGTSSKLDYAKEAWQAAVDQARGHPELIHEIPRNGVRESNGEQTLSTTHGSRYKIAASNSDAGRSLTVHRLMLDELRQHHDFECWNAATNTTNAVPDAQIWTISNQGDDASVVLDSLRGSAMAFIETGQGDRRLGLFEWSAPNGADPTDLAALAQANPNLGHRIDPDALLGAGIRAKAAGGVQLAGFRTEVMCQRVHQNDPAFDPDSWAECGTDEPTDLAAGHRDRVALCVDVSLDGTHATLVAAALLEDARVHAEVVAAWDGIGCTRALRQDLPAIVGRVRPRAFGWFPTGPAAAVAADLADPKKKGGRRGTWPPRGVEVEEIRGELAAVCMGLGDLVIAKQLVHPRDALLTTHATGAQKLHRGDGWVLTRHGATPIDGAYALAGAAHLARTLPPPRAPLTAL